MSKETTYKLGTLLYRGQTYLNERDLLAYIEACKNKQTDVDAANLLANLIIAIATTKNVPA